MGVIDTESARHEQPVNGVYASYNGDVSNQGMFAKSIEVVDPLAELRGRDE